MTRIPKHEEAAPLTWRTDLDFSGIRLVDRETTLGITVHCSATKPSMKWGALEIDKMHRKLGWKCIAYHFVIDRPGIVHAGRPMATKGAHCKTAQRNHTHVSVCLVGGVSQRPQQHVPGSRWNGSDAECNFTPEQAATLKSLLAFLKETYGLTDRDIEGHRDVPGVRKACPSFNVRKFVDTGVMALD